ncbi:MAG TPA: class I SAM-dependent methyltransferase [Phnomibacter sp.]|nr:class I SAM-dependent methyltransferase [Phnomibacter sp.]
MIFYKPIVTLEQLKETYKQLYSKGNEYQVHLDQLAKIQAKKQLPIGYNKSYVIKEVLKHNHSPQFLEIGAGVGFVAQYLLRKGYSYQGLEYEPGIAALSTTTGLPIEQGDFHSLPNLPKNYNTVLFFEVLEHVQDLKEVLTVLKEQLLPGDLIGFTVPNFDVYKNFSKVPNRVYGSPPPIHVNFFTLQSLGQILPAYGFEPIMLKSRPIPQYGGKPMQYIKHWFNYLRGRFYGSNIFCVAKKQ